MTRVLKLLLGTVLLAGTVSAQPAGQGTAPGPAAPAPAEVDISVPQRPTLTSQDMINQGREYRSSMNEVVARIQSLVESARKQKDIIRLNCLTDKLVQVRANLNIADQAVQSLQEAIARKDEGASLHEFTRITIVNQKVQVLGAEAEACIGEDLSFVGATKVDVEVLDVPDISTDPRTDRTPVDRPPVSRPSDASPFR